LRCSFRGKKALMLTARPPLAMHAPSAKPVTSHAVGGSVRGLYPAGRVEVDAAELLDTAITTDSLANPRLAFLFRYWQMRRLGRTMPRRSDIDVLDLGTCLGHLILIDVGEELRSLTYRLFGTRISSHMGFDPTGFDLLQGGLPEDDHIVLPYRTAAKLRTPVYCINTMISPAWTLRWERLILPLSRDDVSVTQLLIAGYPLGDQRLS
jgi:hypothetical protein